MVIKTELYIRKDGIKFWLGYDPITEIHQYHRLTGPAVIYQQNGFLYYINGARYENKEEFDQIIKLKILW